MDFRKFLIVWAGQLLSMVGSGLTGFALGVHAYVRTGMATHAALVTLSSFLPSILLRPIGGILADRFDRRLMMIIGDIGSAAGVAFILIFMTAGEPGLWPVYAGATVSSVFVGIQSPAYKASATDLLTGEQYSKGSGLVQLAESARFLLSPFLAGWMLHQFGIATVLAIDIATYMTAVLTVFLIRKRMKPARAADEGGRWLAELRDGWQAVTVNRGVFLLILMISLVTLFLGFLETLIGPMVLSFSDARTLGTIQTLCALGMLASSLLLGIFSVGRRYADILAAGLFIAGIAFSLIGTTTNVYFITASGFLFLAAMPFVNMSCDVMIRSNIPNEIQGRAWGIIGILSQLGFIAAYATAGPLADYVFNPLLEDGGPLAPTVGRLIGTGPGRGIGFMFVICGLLTAASALVLSRIRSIRALSANVASGPGAENGRAGEPA
ncbi:Major Facilitator Superfamily transporter [Thermobacillus composti KWC4]|uniref:Major Facilitator Superfamily transporter n=1 Tax=Thermobacillus composti (strain DSM 18247 / JCM 13945 / KWC4) TaxID=717605 RepID=L0EK73_THECK|nr:MFS transporter [Thermobacillus composti]AGA59665.1 Major Facilitator Superfamily transporter [Thermobacillus composti KWC4]